MTLFEVSVWRDPLHKLLHDIYQCFETYPHQRLAGYETACGLKLSVDDVNKSNLVQAEPTCLACIVNSVIPGKE
jgi:hypothetical protein